MSIPDTLIYKYFRLCTNISDSELRKIKKQLEDKAANPRDLKAKLAFELVKKYYDEQSAENARKEFETIFVKKELPDEIPEYKLKEKEIKLVNLLKDSGLTDSTSNAIRLINQGGVSIDGEKVSDKDYLVETDKDFILKVGKRKFLKVRIIHSL
jgi:tyrosyl-tRNA synthetase